MSERLSHVDEHGTARMVDVGDKQPTRRRAVAEVLVVTDRLRELIASKAPNSQLRAEAAGMRSLRECALAWVSPLA